MPSSQVVIRHPSSGSRAKLVNFYADPAEIEVLAGLTQQLHTVRGIPASKSLVIRTAIELLRREVQAGRHPEPVGYTKVRKAAAA
jgi:hypothetical protein